MKGYRLSLAVLLLVFWCVHSGGPLAKDLWGKVVPKSGSGPLVWNIDGKEYRIKNTCYVMFPPNLYFFIECELPENADISNITPEQEVEWRTPLIDYAYKNGLYKRIETGSSSCKDMPVIAIGVSFIVSTRAGKAGLDTNERIAEIQARLSGDSHGRVPQ